MDRIIITNDIREQVKIGRELFKIKANVYTPHMVALVKDAIDRIVQGYSYHSIKWGDITKEELFFISIYDYWVVGNNVSEELYYDFPSKTYEEKMEFLTLRTRLLYMDHLNNKDDAHLLNNKYEAYKILKPYYKREVIKIEKEDDFIVFEDFVSRHQEYVVKPEGGGLSVGVHKSSINDFSNSKEAFDKYLEEGRNVEQNNNWIKKSAVVIEEIIEQDERMAAFHPASINSVRITTIKVNDEIHLFYPFIRIGVGGSFISSCATGGVTACVNSDTGIIETDGRTETLFSYQRHPDTNIEIKGFQVPEWDNAVKIVKDAAMKFDTIRYIGWDMVLSKRGWCIMEGNFAGEFAGQIPYQRGFRKEFEELIGWKPNKQFWWE